MERRALLEKLGLIEKVGNKLSEISEVSEVSEVIENSESEKTVEDTVQGPASTEKLKYVNFSKEAEIKEKPEDKIEEKESDDPVSVVRSKNLLKIDDIYKKYNINSDGINSLFIIESFQKALPDFLPTDVKRQSILDIIASSNVKIESLLKDGNEKLKCLNDFSESFASESDSVIFDFQENIEKLKEKIGEFEEAIAEMKRLQNEQNYAVKYETEKINNILQFINSEQ